MRCYADRAVLLGSGSIMEVSWLGRAKGRKHQQAKPNQPDFVTACQRTPLSVHAFPCAKVPLNCDACPGVNSALSN